MLPNAWNYTHVAGAATTDVFTGIGATQATATSPANVGLYGGVVVNTAGTSVTVTDGSGGTTVQIIGATAGQFFMPLPGLQLKAGLRVVTVGAGSDITILWQ